MITTNAPLGSVIIPGSPREMDRFGQHYQVFSYLVPEGVDWREVLPPHWWVQCLKFLDAGDRIEVHDASHQIQFTILVLGCNSVAVPPTLDLGYAAIYPPGLRLPISSSARRHRVSFDPRKNVWDVINPDGEKVAEGIVDREGALKISGSLDQIGDSSAVVGGQVVPSLLAAQAETGVVLRDQPNRDAPVVEHEADEDTVIAVALREARAARRGRGRPRKPAPARSGDDTQPPPMAA